MAAKRHIHVIGAGMAGLSAALQLTLMGEKVTVYESAQFAGGRCRSYFDKGLDCRIDNGNHLVFSGNVAVHDYLDLSGAQNTYDLAPEPFFPFMDLKSEERWSIRMGKGRIPWWVLNPDRRIPKTSASDYLSALNLFTAGENDTIARTFDTKSTLFKRFWEPLAVGSLNTEIENASTELLANLFTQSFGAGGNACRPLMPKQGLSETFVQPCLNTLRQNGTKIKFGHRLRYMAVTNEGRVTDLDFKQEHIKVKKNDWVILAVPPWAAQELIPNLLAPTSFRAITNAHYKIEVPQNPAGFTGLINGLAEWVFVKPGVVSVTISAADRYEEQNQESWAIAIWEDLAKLFNLDPTKIPPFRIVREKRATFAATPKQIKQRPQAYIGWQNVALAGDWTQTSLPSTIEGALRSGVKAAQVVMRWS